MKKILGSSGKYINFGLLVMRLGIGIMFVVHGLPKLQGGPELWTQIGNAMSYIGVHRFPVMWGFLAAITETAGGILLLAGLIFKPACLLLMFVMFMAAYSHFSQNQGLQMASHAIELGIILFSFLITGPGKFSIDNSLFPSDGGKDDDDD
jgi:putative oxidoreductase